MPDMVLQHVEGLLVERIRALARDRQCSVNDVMLYALRHGLGMAGAQSLRETHHDPQMAHDALWEDAEQGVFEEALRALAQAEPTQLAPENVRFGRSALGAE